MREINAMRDLRDPGPPEQEWPNFRRLVFAATEEIMAKADTYPLISPSFMAEPESV